MKTPTKTFDTYETLEEYLRNWRNWGDPNGAYDFNGLMGLLSACLHNLRCNTLEAELEDYKLDAADRTFLENLLRTAR